MAFFKRISYIFSKFGSDDQFLYFLKNVETGISKILSLAMVFVILIAVTDLLLLLIKEILNPSVGEFNDLLIKLFGVFLNVLIALELLENITAYLRKHVIQVELVIVTSLIAVSRKLIILDLKKIDGTQLIGLSIAILTLAISYWIIRQTKPSAH
ncbi:MAG: phosphate-starvation-inducible PsiE family protein [Crinalium sp.]